MRLSGGSALELREVPSTSRTFSRIQRLAAETEQEQIGTDWNSGLVSQGIELAERQRRTSFEDF